MNTLETDIEIAADGSVKWLSPLPAWLKPARVHALLTVQEVVPVEAGSGKQKLTATPEMIAQRMAALEKVRELNPYREITDALAWQSVVREDVKLPGRE